MNGASFIDFCRNPKERNAPFYQDADGLKQLFEELIFLKNCLHQKIIPTEGKCKPGFPAGLWDAIVVK